MFAGIVVLLGGEPRTPERDRVVEHSLELGHQIS
jgi:hypothetical protein